MKIIDEPEKLFLIGTILIPSFDNFPIYIFYHSLDPEFFFSFYQRIRTYNIPYENQTINFLLNLFSNFSNSIVIITISLFFKKNRLISFFSKGAKNITYSTTTHNLNDKSGRGMEFGDDSSVYQRSLSPRRG